MANEPNRRALRDSWSHFTEEERHILRVVLQRFSAPPGREMTAEEPLPFGQRLAGAVASVALFATANTALIAMMAAIRVAGLWHRACLAGPRVHRSGRSVEPGSGVRRITIMRRSRWGD